LSVRIDEPERLLEGLSPAQQEAVVHEKGPLLIVAGAGSGKTRTLTRRAAWLALKGHQPEKILVATFTNRAAREFRERLESLLGEDSRKLWMNTLHSTGVRILRKWGTQGGYDPNFTIYDSRDSLKLLKKLAKQFGLGGDRFPAHEYLGQISFYKERMFTSEDLERGFRDHTLERPVHEDTVKLFHRYQEELQQAGAFDFSDLVVNTVRLLERQPEIRKEIGLQFLLVDEFQDTDPAQWKMLQLLSPEEQNLTLVGDADQAIYRFRGADPSIMLSFERHFKEGKVVSLGQNYRCSRMIVDAAAGVIEKNQGRIKHRLWSEGVEGYPVSVVGSDDPDEEASKISRHCAQVREKYHIPWSQMAVLFRVNYQSRILEQHFLRRNIPYHVVGKRFFDRSEVEDIVDYLRIIHNPKDWMAFEALASRPPRNISDTALAKLEKRVREEGQTVGEALEDLEGLRMIQDTRDKLTRIKGNLVRLKKEGERLSLSQLAKQVFASTELIDWHKSRESKTNQILGDSTTDNVDHLIELIEHQFEGPATEQLPDFLSYAAMMSEDGRERQEDAVQLLTVHSAKGTEYRAVWIAGCEEGLMPHWRNILDHPTEGLEEERRLFYVAMTRAKDLLFLYHAFNRQVGKEYKRNKPSRFLNDIPEHRCRLWRTDGY
jgi:DNA helicase II / ATP-dependent DNA helicase PcrA